MLTVTLIKYPSAPPFSFSFFFFSSCSSTVDPVPIWLIQSSSFALYILLSFRIAFTHSSCCPHPHPHPNPYFLSFPFFALSFRPNHMHMLNGTSTLAAHSPGRSHPPLLRPLLRPQLHPRLRVLRPAQAAPTLEFSMMVLAIWLPSVAKSLSRWIGRPSRLTLPTVSI